ncbi:Hypothetical predicted protein [Marmota monax]|uniref:Uncharacterized protein n=1 Tax=Marmota monax TaxID=9995 RepID=A0A5E4C5V7_MARMO|nr:Hypothetical predicted protein [Marmota monax]
MRVKDQRRAAASAPADAAAMVAALHSEVSSLGTASVTSDATSHATSRTCRFTVGVPVGLEETGVFLLRVLVALVLLMHLRVAPLHECIPGGLSASGSSIEILGLQRS